MSSKLIKDLQTFLNDQGFDAGDADGLEGPNTLKALRSYLDSVGYAPAKPEVVSGVTGRSTVFGLNYSGSIDTGDNGQGFFGYNTRNKALLGVSLPVSVLDGTLGAFGGKVADLGSRAVEIRPGKYLVPSVAHDIKSGRFQVRVTNKAGKQIVASIVDVGPAAWTGNAIDLTYGAARALETHGDATVTYEMLDNGEPIEIKGWPAKVK
jgi:hypothetical protein